MTSSVTEPTVRTEATVTVKEAVDGTVKRKKRGPGKGRGAVTHTHVKVRPDVMAMAKQVCLPNQRLRIVPEEEVLVVNRT